MPAAAPSRATWLTTDAEEIATRRQRARDEPMSVRRAPGGSGIFADYQVAPLETDEAARSYTVEIRTLGTGGNFCSCPDFAKNFLGTCKHIEKVLLDLAARGAAPGDSPFIEVHTAIDPEDKPLVHLPAIAAEPRARAFIERYLDGGGGLRAPWRDSLLVLLRDLRIAHPDVQAQIRVSRGVWELSAHCAAARERTVARERFQRHFNPETLLRLPLYPYQAEGVVHLAFTGRAMLADAMGLGKTVQAIGACKVLRDLYQIRRVLIVCPASLKAEWEEQIGRFTTLSCRILRGSPPERLRTYQHTEAFFVIANYEQVVRDEAEINEVLQPEVVLLDEAQRIKNWKTKTARAIKRLQSRYAFVLTGTPLENRIDELYSLVDFVSPRLLGSLFRFNRRFYRFDEAGHLVGPRNLEGLHRLLKPIMLRRRRDDIRDQLPERIDNNYFVPLSREQRDRYRDHESRAAALCATAGRRPLKPDEFQQLQRLLGCMRMLCDAVRVVAPDADPSPTPKIDELVSILRDIWSEDPGRKIIVFSEWTRMLELVRDRLEAESIPACVHTGALSQTQRRREIERFRTAPDANLFLSSDSGSVGLNLQAASVVINLDLPWNAARLEQRIARAWRSRQERSVNVINIIAENTIEQRMLATMERKRRLADGVLDGIGDWEDLEHPAARQAFMHRLSTILARDLKSLAPTTTAPAGDGPGRAPALPPAELFRQEATVALGRHLSLCSIATDDDDAISRVLAVAPEPDAAAEAVAETLRRTHGAAHTADITVIKPDQYALLRSLAEKGLVVFNDDTFSAVIRDEPLARPTPDIHARRRDAAAPHLRQAARAMRMATVLEEGGFPIEALEPARQALQQTAAALGILADAPTPADHPVPLAILDFDRLRRADILPPDALRFLEHLPPQPDDEAGAVRLLEQTRTVIDLTETHCHRTALTPP